MFFNVPPLYLLIFLVAARLHPDQSDGRKFGLKFAVCRDFARLGPVGFPIPSIGEERRVCQREVSGVQIADGGVLTTFIEDSFYDCMT